MKRPFSIVGAILIAVVLLAMGIWIVRTISAQPDFSAQPVSEYPANVQLSSLFGTIIFATLVGIPFCIWVPLATAGRLGRIWGLPSSAFLVPRWVIYSYGTLFLGITLVLCALTLLTGFELAPIFLGFAIDTAFFLHSAYRRFSRGPATEFVFPLRLPYPFRRRM